MGAFSTSGHILKLMSDFAVEGKNILELGYLPGSRSFDFKEHFSKRKANVYRSNLSGNKEIDFPWDLHEPLPKDAPIKKFDYVICSSVMEHVKRPWVATKNIEEIIEKEGTLIWTTPWVWRMHGYPNDYWRFTPNAIKELFSKISWSWTGYEVTNGVDRSVLLDTAGWDKDACIQFSPQAYRNLKGSPYYATRMNLKATSANFAHENEIRNLKILDNSDKFFYEFIMSDKLSAGLCPMSNFIMIGQKKHKKVD